MKRVNIITPHRVHNYGSILQAYATIKLFERAGAIPELADYCPEDCQPTYLLSRWLADSPRWHRSPLHRAAFRLAKAPSLLRQNQVFSRFLLNRLPLSPRSYRSAEELQQHPPEADLYCSGSDQVFNSLWWNRLETAYWLDWVPMGKPKISFCSSFGRSTLEDWELSAVSVRLAQYRLLSFREESAINLIRRLGIPAARHGDTATIDTGMSSPTAFNAAVLTDPVLLLPQEEWDAFSISPNENPGYILLYQLTRCPGEEAFAVHLAKRLGRKLLRISSCFDQAVRPGRLVCCPAPEAFVGLFRNAGYVVTDSFHGTAFSLLFHRPFTVFLPTLYPDRLEDLLQRIGLTGRIASSAVNIDPLPRWDTVDRFRREQREKAGLFLKRALTDLL